MFTNFVKIVISETIKTFKNPLRLKNIFNKRLFLSWLWSFRPEEKTEWSTWSKSGFTIRNYNNYQQYSRHQGSKLERIMLDGKESWLNYYDVGYRDILRERLKERIPAKGMNVLCLAARLGTEVKAFIDLGCFAVGIDLNPGNGNKYVVNGDFHDLQYADESIDIVFTNSFDHVLHPERILSEIKRILKPQGQIFIELSLGTEEGSNPGDYETFFWRKIEEVIRLFQEYSFELIYEEIIAKPFNGGKFLIFKKDFHNDNYSEKENEQSTKIKSIVA
jgi:SAM-dependent methyltransferase